MLSRLARTIVCLICLLTVALPLSHASGADRRERARLLTVKGLVKLHESGAASWQKAVLPGCASLAGGDELQTYQQASATIGMDGHRFVLGPLTRVTIPADTPTPRRASRLHLLAGRLLIWIIGARPVEIGTAGAVAAAKSTQFAVEADEEGQTTLTVFEGAVEFFNQLGTVTVAAGERSVAAPTRAPTRPSRVDPSAFHEWEFTLDSTWLGFEKLYQPGLSPEALRERAAAAKQAADAAPNDPRAQVEAADDLHDLGDLDAAETYYLKARRQQPDDPATALKLGYNMLQQGRPAAEIAAQFAAAGKAGAGAAALAGEALALASSVEAGKPTAAAALAAQAQQAAPGDPDVALARGLTALRLGDAPAARAALQQAAAAQPFDYRAAAYLSLLLLQDNDREGAFASARRAVAAAPASCLAHQSLGTVAFYAGDLKEAAAEARLAGGPGCLSPAVALLRADVALAGGDLETGLAELETTLVLDPRQPRAFVSLGMIALAQNDLARAEKAFTRALALDPGLVTARTGLGLTWTRQDRFRQALQLQEGAAALDPSQAAVRNNLGLVYLQTGRLAQAKQAFAAAIELQPNWALPHGNLALAHLESNEYAQALREAETAVRLGGDSARVRTTLARVYLRQNRVNAAWAQLRRALALDDTYALAHMHLAEVYVRLGRSDDADRERLRALTLQPSVMVDNRDYARTELQAAAGDGEQAFARTMGRGDAGQTSYYVAGRGSTWDADRPRTDVHEATALAIAGHQTAADNTTVLYAAGQAQAQERPGPALLGGAPTDTDFTSAFHGGEIQGLTRRPIGHGIDLTTRAGWRAIRYTEHNADALDGDSNPLRFSRLNRAGPMAEFRLDKRLDGRSSLALGGAWLNQRNEVVHLSGDGAPPVFSFRTDLAHRRYGSGYLEYTRCLDDRTSLLLGGRAATVEGMQAVLRPKLSLRRQLSADSTLVLLTRPVLADDVSELSPVDEYSLRPFLEPLALGAGGYSQSYELQYEWLPSNGGVARLALFHRDFRNLLVDLDDPLWSTDVPSLLVPSASARGVEAELEYPLGRDLSAGLWLRYADSENLSGGGYDLPALPRVLAQARLDYLDDAGWRLGAVWTQTGHRYADTFASLPLNSYGVLDLNLARQENLHTDIFVQVENALNRNYEFYRGYPGAGRHVLAGVRYRF